MSRIEIDRGICMKSGQCAYMHPELFRLDESGKPVVLVAEPTVEDLPGARDASDICPSQAISIVD